MCIVVVAKTAYEKNTILRASLDYNNIFVELSFSFCSKNNWMWAQIIFLRFFYTIIY